MIPYRKIEETEHIDTPLSPEMVNNLSVWYDVYRDKAPWLKPGEVKSMNLGAFVAGEIARQVLLEVKWNITGTGNGEDGQPDSNPRADYLRGEFERLMDHLRQKLEAGCAAGGMIIKPCPNPADGRIYFDYSMDWAFYPVAFDGAGNLTDVIIPEILREGKIIYTRLERHTREGENVVITQRAFKSELEDSLGKEISLTEVERWAELPPKSTVTGADGMLFGWYRAASANNTDVGCPLGASVYARALDVIKEADMQYSRLLWEFEGSELAIDVDPLALRPKPDGEGGWLPKLNKRLFRAVDVANNGGDMYKPYNPAIRDGSLINGLNQLLMRVEDLTGLSRGTLSDANIDARTATELRIVKQRSYATIADNQKALEACLKDVVKAMDVYATAYNLAPAGEYDISFEWDDSILTDASQQLQERMLLLNSGVISKSEFRQWYFGETEAQAIAAVQAVDNEKAAALENNLPALDVNDNDER